MNLYTQRRSRARLRSRQRGGGWGLLLPALLASVVDELVVFEKEPGKRQRLGAGGAAATTTTLRPSFFFGAAAVTSSTAPYVCILPARRGEQRIHNYCTRLTLSSLATEQFSDAAVPCTGREALWSLRRLRERAVLRCWRAHESSEIHDGRFDRRLTLCVELEDFVRLPAR